MLGSIAVFFVVLSILILIHELGHFVMAKRAGLWVEEFGFGIPPRIWGKKVGETIYSINVLPFGGFVKIHGQDQEDKILKPERAFYAKSKRIRASIVVAGIVMNLLLGIVAFSIVYSFSGIPRQTDNVKIIGVTPETPAQASDLRADDQILTVGAVTVRSTGEFISEIAKYKGTPVEIIVKRQENGDFIQKKLKVTPRSEYPQDQGPLGVVITSSEIYFPPVWQRPFLGAYYGVKEALFWGKTIVVGVGGMITGLFSGQIPRDIAGPVGIYAITSEAAKVGLLALINFVGILSINLAILNLLPFPALDGGILFFILIESIIGRKILPKVEAVAHKVGFIILIMLLVAITFADIRRLITAGSLANFIESFAK